MARKRKTGGFLFLIIIALIVFVGWSVYNSQKLEKDSPKISLQGEIYWNLKNEIPIEISDNSGLKSVKISFGDGKNNIVISDQKFKNSPKNIKLNISLPKTAFIGLNKNIYHLIIEANDKSWWNMFSGNKSISDIVVHIDIKRPEIYVLNQSYSIAKGGSASVVFRATDKNLKDVYIVLNSGKIFKAIPFYKPGYYASIIAWPIQQKSFNASVVATDLAGNKTISHIKYFLKDRNYKESTIMLKDKFLDGRIQDLIDYYAPDTNLTKLQKFKYVNETLRTKNEDLIHSVTSNVPENMVSNFHILPFYPLKNASVVASFGDHRFYTYMDKGVVSQSWHLGIDLASTAMANIVSTNKAIVAFADKNGIYGNNLILYHGMGLYTLYGHCSAIKVQKGNLVNSKEIVANTGKTGLALGDHLHFGVLVQGVEVRPEEWMDPKWMKDNIFDILNDSKKMINKI